MYSRTPAKSLTTRYSSLTGSPHSRSRSYQPDWLSGRPVTSPSIRPTPCRIRPSGRLAVTAGSFCRSDPAAVFRGFTYGGLPAAAWRSFSSPNALTGRNTSPLTSSVAGHPDPDSRAGAAAIVRTFAVTSSPVTPSPLVAARLSVPSR